MSSPLCYLAGLIVLYTAWLIYSNAKRIQKKFFLADGVKLDDLTNFPSSTISSDGNYKKDIDKANTNSTGVTTSTNSLLGRNRKSAVENV